MATILIIEDSAIDRKLLSTTLKLHGHDVLEASDGADGLQMLERAKVDLVISDIMMPSVDGYEFVRRMREQPALASIPVIFYTATYHESEARALANKCGVFDILVKPSPRATILSTINAALRSPAPQSQPLGPRADFDREHLQVVSHPPAARSGKSEAEKHRLAALMDAARGISGERDAALVLKAVCAEARHITLAQHAVTALFTEDDATLDMLYTSGVDEATANTLGPQAVAGSAMVTQVKKRRPVRLKNPDGRPESLDLPPEHPRVSSLLSVPIASASRVYGCLSLRNKLGAEEFTEVDEYAAVTLATYAGIAYENARLIGDLTNSLSALEEERQRVAARAHVVRDEEELRLSRVLHDELGQALTGLKVDLAWIDQQMASGEALSDDQLRERVASMRQRVDEILRVVRRISSERRPPTVVALGLVAALEQQAEDFERRSGIRCRVHTRLTQVNLDAGRSTSVVGIVQEALLNVQRHARATRVRVALRSSARLLTLSVSDNGRGIAEADMSAADSLGLIGMRERAALLGGTLQVRPRRPRGTTVTLTVPLADRRQRPRG